jgi:CRP/FNR family cyclic AMP-dependent transcriptional regulator
MLQKIFKTAYSSAEQKNIDTLKSFWLFDDFIDEELYLLLPYLYHRTFHKDEIIFFQDDPAQSIYLMENGDVKIYLEINKGEEDLMHLHKKDTFGENAVFENSRRNYSAIVMSDKADIIMIPQVCLQSIFDKNPGLKGKLFYNVAHKYYDFTRKLVHTYTKDQGFFEIKSVFQNHNDE